MTLKSDPTTFCNENEFQYMPACGSQQTDFFTRNTGMYAGGPDSSLEKGFHFIFMVNLFMNTVFPCKCDSVVFNVRFSL